MEVGLAPGSARITKIIHLCLGWVIRNGYKIVIVYVCVCLYIYINYVLIFVMMECIFCDREWRWRKKMCALLSAWDMDGIRRISLENGSDGRWGS